MPDERPPVPWHAQPAALALERLKATPAGLTATEAARRLRQFGPNRLPIAPPTSAWKLLVAQLRGIVVLLLVAAALVSALAGEVVESLAILAVLVINTALGFATELRARRAIEALQSLDVPVAVVVRDGQAVEIAAAELVPGEVVEVEAGRAVPADARLLSAVELRVDEAALTGESVPVEKRVDAALDADTPLAERTTMLYKGTTVVAGAGRAAVVGTAADTEVGRIGVLTSGVVDEATPLERRLDDLGRRLVWVTLAIAAVVIALGIARGQAVGLVVETGIALAIAAVPEGLPAVATITLAVGVWRMARRAALVRRLPAVEALGSATVVCTDKTGTLTGGEMTVTTLVLDGRRLQVTGGARGTAGTFVEGNRPLAAGDEPLLAEALRIAALANRAELVAEDGQWRASGDPTEVALLVAAGKAGMLRPALRHDWPELAAVPFSSERQWMATFHGDGGRLAVLVKGAPGRVLERSAHLLTANGERPLTAADRERLTAENHALAARGLRVLALARGHATASKEAAVRGLTFVGLVGLEDPPAAGVPETVRQFREAGIRTVMITGDQRLTAEAIAHELGILTAGGETVGGRELQHLEDAELERRIDRVAVLNRVSPEDKLRVVGALQRRGEIVAMLGDGVNDAAALKKADVGVAMGKRGTDVAKEAADVILQDDRFATIGAAIEEGRVIFDNIRKFVFYLFSCNLAEVLLLLVAGVVGLPQPLTPLQLLWLNLVTDTFPAFALAVEPAEPGLMRRPPRDPAEAILSPRFLRSVAGYAAMITAVTLGALLIGLSRGGPEHGRTFAFATLGIAQALHLGTARSERAVLLPHLALRNRWALAAVVLAVGLQVAAVQIAPLGALLDVTQLRATDWLLVGVLAAVPAVIGQAVHAVAWRGRRVVRPTH